MLNSVQQEAAAAVAA
ncbi:hypothetical protein HaLaN_20719, partial [Haematococcus lacustris]